MLNCFTADEAARELGCTVRTVWRDLAVLQKANFPLYDDKDGRRVRYRLVDGFRLTLRWQVPELLQERERYLTKSSGAVVEAQRSREL